MKMGQFKPGITSQEELDRKARELRSRGKSLGVSSEEYAKAAQKRLDAYTKKLRGK